MTANSVDPLREVRDLYEKSLREHGATPRGVGWRDDDSHRLRFAKLSSLLEPGTPSTIADLGCGYGAFLDFLRASDYRVEGFTGYDISAAMIEEARRRYPDASWRVGSRIEERAAYCFASGIFNVRFAEPEEKWRDFVVATLDNLHETSTHGFAFNLLSTYVDYREPHLFYADPAYFFDLCKRRYAKRVALLHDYPLFEWTMLVRK